MIVKGDVNHDSRIWAAKLANLMDKTTRQLPIKTLMFREPTIILYQMVGRIFYSKFIAACRIAWIAAVFGSSTAAPSAVTQLVTSLGPMV